MLHSREALAPVFADLNQYDATTHFVGQSTIFTLTTDRATGEAYCLAHHVTVDGAKRRLMLASLRYLDTFVKMEGAWLFAERKLYVDWLEERALARTLRRRAPRVLSSWSRRELLAQDRSVPPDARPTEWTHTASLRSDLLECLIELLIGHVARQLLVRQEGSRGRRRERLVPMRLDLRGQPARVEALRVRIKAHGRCS